MFFSITGFLLLLYLIGNVVITEPLYPDNKLARITNIELFRPYIVALLLYYQVFYWGFVLNKITKANMIFM